MSDLRADCDWHDGTLFLVLPEDPERIGVRLFPSRQAPSRMYVPEEKVVKLRELVREIWRSCPVSEDDCMKCPHRIEESDEVWCDIPILMEALGVEVDG